jgi:hypothetical protein
MKSRMMILAALFGFVMLAAPGVASAHPMPAWRRANAIQRFQSMGPHQRYIFRRNHPFLARQGMLNQRYGMQNGWVGNQPYAGGYGPGGWGQRAGYMNQEPDGDEGGYQRPCPIQRGYGGGDGDGDDGGGYGGGYAMPMGGYGPGYGGNYSPIGAMLGNFIP